MLQARPGRPPDATRRRWFENLGEGAYAGVTEVVFEGP